MFVAFIYLRTVVLILMHDDSYYCYYYDCCCCCWCYCCCCYYSYYYYYCCCDYVVQHWRGLPTSGLAEPSTIRASSNFPHGSLSPSVPASGKHTAPVQLRSRHFCSRPASAHPRIRSLNAANCLRLRVCMEAPDPHVTWECDDWLFSARFRGRNKVDYASDRAVIVRWVWGGHTPS